MEEYETDYREYRDYYLNRYTIAGHNRQVSLSTHVPTQFKIPKAYEGKYEVVDKKAKISSLRRKRKVFGGISALSAVTAIASICRVAELDPTDVIALVSYVTTVASLPPAFTTVVKNGKSRYITGLGSEIKHWENTPVWHSPYQEWDKLAAYYNK